MKDKGIYHHTWRKSLRFLSFPGTDFVVANGNPVWYNVCAIRQSTTFRASVTPQDTELQLGVFSFSRPCVVVKMIWHIF